MHFLPFVLAVAVATFETSGRSVRSDPVLVRAVIDGNTIDVAAIGRVRLIGIEAPGGKGGGASPSGQEARARLADLVLRHYVRLESDGGTPGTLLRRAYVMREDGLFVNAVLVREGLARVSARQPFARLGELEAAQREAQAFNRGMWSRTSAGRPERRRPERHVVPPVTGATGDRYTASAKKQKRRAP